MESFLRINLCSSSGRLTLKISKSVEDDFQCSTKGRKKAGVTKNVVNTEVKKERFIRFGDGEVLDLTI